VVVLRSAKRNYQVNGVGIYLLRFCENLHLPLPEFFRIILIFDVFPFSFISLSPFVNPLPCYLKLYLCIRRQFLYLTLMRMLIRYLTWILEILI